MISKNTISRVKTGIVLFFTIFLMIKFNFIAVYILLIFATFAFLEFLAMTEVIFKKKIFKYMTNLLFLSYLSIFCFFFFYSLNIFYLKIIIFILLFGCISSDIGGYIVGNIFKGPRLSKISPKKTISGALGSIIFTFVVVTIIIFFNTNTFSYLIFIVSTLTSIGCQLGDLFFSYLKRKSKIKDTGTILPGHGGILDRVDGILLGIPTGAISLILFT